MMRARAIRSRTKADVLAEWHRDDLEAVRAEEREAMRAKCEAIAQAEADKYTPWVHLVAKRIADDIADLKDK